MKEGTGDWNSKHDKFTKGATPHEVVGAVAVAGIAAGALLFFKNDYHQPSTSQALHLITCIDESQQ